MDRNKRILKINEKTINFYDYYITNSCIIKFIDIDINVIKNFFGDTVITKMQEIDSNGKIIKEEDFYFKKKHIFIENTTIIEKEIKVIKDAYDEEVYDEELQESTIIHHPAETETIEHVIPVEMTNVTLEKPEIQDEVYVMKGEIKELKTLVNTPIAAQDPQAKMLMNYVAYALPDEKIIDVPNYVPEWEVGMDIKENDRVSVRTENGELEIYKCKKNKAHIADETNKPGTKGSASIWHKITKTK